MQLMKFVCSFAWADLEIHRAERAFVQRMMARLELDTDECAQVRRWLERPPSPQETDPTTIPVAHRKAFIESIVGVIESDGVVTQEERDHLALFEQLLR